MGTARSFPFAALRAPAQLHWDASYVLVSIAIAMTFAAAAMRVLLPRPALGGRLMAVVLLVLAIVGLHFTAMAAVTFVPDPLIAVPGHAIAPNVLAIAIATVIVLTSTKDMPPNVDRWLHITES